MLAEGELPGTVVCARCGSTTPEIVGVIAECEKAWIRGPNDGPSFLIAFLLVGFWAFLLRQQDSREFGRTLTLELPVRLCPTCQQTMRRDSPMLHHRMLPIGLTVLGLLALILWSAWVGLLLLAGSALVWWIGRTAKKRQQAAIKTVLRHIPIYEALLQEYPEANVHWPSKLANRGQA
jgi:hypothetical protein